MEEGVSGFFLATQCATKDYISLEEHRIFGEAYDLRVCKSFCDSTDINILHIHGPNTYFEELAKYPVNCINWHDRWVEPSMADARKLTDKCLLGGINEKWLEYAHHEEVAEHLRQAVSAAGRNKLILTPGCCIEMTTPEISLYAVRVAACSLS
jgi:uroporphyrinogen decarboxylase